MTQFLAEQKMIVKQTNSIKKLVEELTVFESLRSSKELLELSCKVEKLGGLILDTLRRQSVLDAMKHVETLLNNGADLKSISIDGIHFAIRDGEIVHVPNQYDDLPF